MENIKATALTEALGIGFFIVYIVLPILGIIFIIKFFDINFSGGDEIKAYSAICKTKVESNRCDNPEYPQSIRTYKVSYASQQVISESGGFVDKYTDCTIKDKKNWKCSFDDKSGDFGFMAGTYFDIPNWDKVKLFKDLAEKTYHPSRLEYIGLQTEGWGCKGLMYPVCYAFVVMTN